MQFFHVSGCNNKDYQNVRSRIIAKDYRKIKWRSGSIEKFGILQGSSWQSIYFEMALTGRNMQVRFCLKVVLESRELLKRSQQLTSQRCSKTCRITKKHISVMEPAVVPISAYFIQAQI